MCTKPVKESCDPDITCAPTRVSNQSTGNQKEKGIFDVDSDPVGIDNRCSACMSHVRSDFKGNIVKTTRTIQVFGGSKIFKLYLGTITWRIEDDEGYIHSISIPGSYFVPEGSSRLISPQHWAQQAEVNNPAGTSCLTLHDRTILPWGNSFRKTVKIDSQNVFTFQLAPGYTNFTALCAEIGYDQHNNDHHPEVMECNYPHAIIDPGIRNATSSSQQHATSDGPTPHTDSQQPVTIDGPTLPTANKDQPTTQSTLDVSHKDPSAKLLKYHCQFGHIPFRQLQAMAAQGVIPSKLAKCPIPVCAACLYGKGIKRSKRTKIARSLQPAQDIMAAGDCVSVDILVSETTGLVAQMSGFLTRQRYKYVCIFVDHHSDFSFVHLMKSQEGVEVVEAKNAFEAYAASSGVDIKHYHADNGIFHPGYGRKHVRTII